jgi:hypothetical protein
MTDPHGTDDAFHDRPGMVAFEDVDTAIRHEVEVIAQRFPDTDVATIETAVREVYAELSADAEVETHVLALTRHRVYDRLEQQGHAFQPPIADESDTGPVADTESDSGSDTGLRAG